MSSIGNSGSLMRKKFNVFVTIVWYLDIVILVLFMTLYRMSLTDCIIYSAQ